MPLKAGTSVAIKNDTSRFVLQRVFTYKEQLNIKADTLLTDAYLRYSFNTVKRNLTLMSIPSMYVLSRGKRGYYGEIYNGITITNGNVTDVKQRLNVGTIPHKKETMSVIWKYLCPTIYNETIFETQSLSPFNSNNSKLYKYVITNLTDNRVEIVFMPKRYNTQLVRGSAIVDKTSGRIISMRINGEFDMVSFTVYSTMGENGILSLIPKTCDINTVFHFMGNKIVANCMSVYDVKADSIIQKGINEMSMIREIRTDSLPNDYKTAYEEREKHILKTDSIEQEKEEKRFDRQMLNFFGDHIISRTKGSFGPEDKGSFRLSPIFNPLYLSYSAHKGITYKLKLRAFYNFTTNSDISLRTNIGYSFKLNQIYVQAPIRYTYNKKRDGFIEIEIGNGNRITSSAIIDKIKNEDPNIIDWKSLNLDYFKDFYIRNRFNYDLNSHWGIQTGFTYHIRSAVDKSGFEMTNQPTKYRSFAPTLQIQYLPIGKKGPLITADYERGIKVGNATMDYERMEFDLSWKKPYNSLKSLSLRAGSGFYTSKSRNAYFLDYTNFKEQNIPGGWNDDWSGEFQLLNSNWYNASKYYVRTNTTYESPLMILSRLPWVGRYMEMERIYINVLFVNQINPYVEYGYGFTNRFFSMGIFAATRNEKFDGIGCRFSFEIFRDW